MQRIFALAGLVAGGYCGVTTLATSSGDQDVPSPEYFAVYALGTGDHTLQISAAVGEGSSFEEDSIAFMVVPSTTADAVGLEEAEEASELGEHDRGRVCSVFAFAPATPGCERTCRAQQ